MKDLIEDLRQDHENMAKLLRILQRQLKIFGEGGQPDWEIISAIAAYFLDYPDLCHHPKEDLVARRMMALDKERAKHIRGLEARHEELAALLARFVSAVRDVLDERELRRDQFLRVGGEFIDSQLRHIEMEELRFFPLARDMLATQDLAALRADLPEVKDPLFGEDVEERFGTLFQNIVEWDLRERA